MDNSVLFIFLFLNIMSIFICASRDPTDSCEGDDWFRCALSEDDETGCISMRYVCDMEVNCPKGEDEIGCESGDVACQNGQFRCLETQECIMENWVCDGDLDCVDGSDEFNCNITTNMNEFECDNGDMIVIDWLCDGQADCTDGSDESRCMDPNGDTQCHEDEFQCSDYECLSMMFRCDGDRDCVDGSDERGCEDIACTGGGWRCNISYTQCIAPVQVCDGEMDCVDSADELFCPQTLKCDPAKTFDCMGDGSQCIPLSEICDGRYDCRNDADEGVQRDSRDSLCDKANPCDTNNGECEHLCIFTLRSYICDCNPGYQLSPDGRSCIDIDECVIFGTCPQKCVNSVGSYECICESGYTLKSGMCKADIASSRFLFTNGDNIYMGDTQTTTSQIVVPYVQGTYDIDYDIDTQNVYWSNSVTGRLYRKVITEDTPAPEVLIPASDSTPGPIAYDWINKNLYWADIQDTYGTIEVMSLGSEPRWRTPLLNDSIFAPESIVLDPRPSQNWIFWIDDTLYKAGLDGSMRKTLVQSDEEFPSGLTIDYTTNRLYWTNRNMYFIQSCDYNGENIHAIPSAMDMGNKPVPLTIFENSVWWASPTSNVVYSVDKFGSTKHISSRHLQEVDVDIISVLTSYHYVRQPQGVSVCSEQVLCNLCLPSPPAKGESKHICACDDRSKCSYEGTLPEETKDHTSKPTKLGSILTSSCPQPFVVLKWNILIMAVYIFNMILQSRLYF